MSKSTFDNRLKAFVVTELAGVLKEIAEEKRELEEAVEDFEMEELRETYGAWA